MSKSKSSTITRYLAVFTEDGEMYYLDGDTAEDARRNFSTYGDGSLLCFVRLDIPMDAVPVLVATPANKEK